MVWLPTVAVQDEEVIFGEVAPAAKEETLVSLDPTLPVVLSRQLALSIQNLTLKFPLLEPPLLVTVWVKVRELPGVKVPLIVGWLGTVRSGKELKVAVTVLSAFIGIFWHWLPETVPPALAQVVPQPAKVEPESALAVRVTEVPEV